MNIHRTLQTEYRRVVLSLLIATSIALLGIVVQNQWSLWTGIGTPSVLYACQGPHSGC